MADVARALIPSVPDDWLLDASTSHQSPRNLTQALRLDGPLDLAALEKSVEFLINRYQTLRSPPVETRDASSDVLPIQDFSSLPLDARESEARRYMHQQADAWLELKGGPLLGAALARLSPSENILLIGMHRSLSDAGILIANVVGELSVLYNAAVNTQLSPLLKLVKPQVASDRGGLATVGSPDYRKQQAENTTAVLELPVDHPRSSQPRGIFGRQSHMLPKALMASVREFSNTEHLESFTPLAAAFAALLSRHCGQQQFFVGAPLTNLESCAEPVPSGFPALSPWRADLSGEPSFRQLAQRVQRRSLQAALQAHQPDGLRPDFPLFQVALIWEQPAREAVHFSGLSVVPYEMEARSTGLELVLQLEEYPAGLLMTADYDAALFDAGTIQRFLGHYETLLASALSDPDGSVSRLRILTEPERQRILVEWNSPDVEYSGEKCVHRLFEEQARKTPDAIAVVFEEASLSYSELNRLANQLAHHLQELGVGPDGRVAVCVERGFEMMVALLAVLKAGGAYVPMDPSYPEERLRYMLKDSAPVALLTEGHLHSLFAGLSEAFPVLDLDDRRPRWKDQPETDLDAVSVGLTGRHLAYVIYTSGSTGAPKGVMVEHRNVARLFTATDAWFRFSGNDIWTLFHSYSFDFSVWEIWGALLHGGRLIIVPKDLARSPQEFYKLICREKVTILNQTPSAFRQLIAAQADSAEVHELRLVIFGGEALEVSTLKPWYEQNHNQHARLINMYGITETTVHVSYRPLEPFDTEGRGGSPIGCRIPDLRIYILDAHGEPVPIGVAGELHVAGAGVARGYLNRPELTEERFVADPFVDHGNARMYKTGDVGRWLPDGTIEFLGRNDFQVKIRGFRIELGEIEARLAEHRGVREAVVVAREGTAGDKRLIAYYTSDRNGPAPGAKVLRDYLSGKLPEYMVPAAYVRLESLPLTPNGKLDRKMLPAPEVDAYPLGGNETEAPADQIAADQIEERLKHVFCSVLGLSAVGVNDDFFDLGGQSLMVAQLFREINFRFNLELPLATLFQAPTIRHLAALIRNSGGEQMSAPVVQIQRHGSQPPVYCIGPVEGELIVFRGLAKELGKDQPLYGLQPFRLFDKLHSVEQLAAAYLDELRKMGESRPFCLLGYCFGGLVAVEMARQLERDGNAPPTVVLIDAAYPAGVRASEPWAERIRRYRYFLRQVTNGGGWSHFCGRVKFAFARIAHRASSKAGVSIANNGAKDVSTMQGLAYESYRLKSYNGRVHLFRAESRYEFLTGGADLGWSGVLSNLVVDEVPGDHTSINTGANLKVLARKVRECLRAPLANGQPRA
jgi:amino acid adenylation domain-containing protein